MSTARLGHRDIGSYAIAMSASELAEWLRLRVNERNPAAVVRFGSGEARLLLTGVEDAESMGAIINHLRQETGLSLSPGAALEISALVRHAYDEADVLGIRFSDHTLDAHRTWMHRLAADYASRVAAGRPAASLAHCLLNHDILETLPELLAGRSVSVISCRNLKPTLEAEWGLDDVTVYQVPSQYTVRDVDGAFEAALHDARIWPDVHAQLRTELTVRERGEVFLVGAGLFGKDLCIHIRDRGGIALDMGSALDHVAGKLTRGPRRRLLDFYASGMSMHQIAARVQRLYGVQVDDRQVSEEIAEAVLDDLETWRSQPLERAYSTLYFDSLQVEVDDGRLTQSRICHLAVGVTCESYREPVGIWWEDAGGAEFWPAVLKDLRNRGLRDLPVICVDEAQRQLADAVAATFPGTQIQVAPHPIESCVAIRRATEAHGRFGNEQAATTLIYLALNRAEVDLPGSLG